MGGTGLSEEEIAWNIKNMPYEVTKKYLIRGLEADRIDVNPLHWTRLEED